MNKVSSAPSAKWKTPWSPWTVAAHKVKRWLPRPSAAQNAADLAKQRYSAGLIDFQAVLDAERDRAQQRRQPGHGPR